MSGSAPGGPGFGWPCGLGYGAAYNPQTSVLAGATPLQLQSWLTSAQVALGQLMTGARVVTVSYAQADGARSVTYTAAQQGALNGWIIQLQRQLGLPTPGRRPIRPFFR